MSDIDFNAVEFDNLFEDIGLPTSNKRKASEISCLSEHSAVEPKVVKKEDTADKNFDMFNLNNYEILDDAHLEEESPLNNEPNDLFSGLFSNNENIFAEENAP